MSEKEPENGQTEPEVGVRIHPVESGDVSPVEPEMIVEPTEPERLIPSELISTAASQLSVEISDRLEELFKGKFEPIDAVRTARVELDGAFALVEVRVYLRNL